ncbi:hypothetical protein [Flagellimonas marinaquae]|uniref:hypothetical protein n=1 Tax=Flagellimonas marinaquae TaxID=254955 RepID=UPI0020755124|nr:hypothetical protein [Allomuricauda aquimarina]USD25805.1 hypothetical protein MJO53_02650 [Allomuricauda aquimarina]
MENIDHVLIGFVLNPTILNYENQMPNICNTVNYKLIQLTLSIKILLTELQTKKGQIKPYHMIAQKSQNLANQ